MAAQVEELATGLGLPHHQAVIAVARGEQHAVRAEFEGRHPFGVLFHLGEELAVGRIVNPHDLARAAERDHPVVGADVGGEDDVVFLADLERPLARLHVPDDGQARLTASAAAGQQQ